MHDGYIVVLVGLVTNILTVKVGQPTSSEIIISKFLLEEKLIRLFVIGHLNQCVGKHTYVVLSLYG